MKLKYYEKLMIAIIVFLGFTIATGFIIGIYANTKKANDNQKQSGSIILENINFY